MKFTLVLLVAAAVLGCVLSCSDEQFADFKAKYNKKYADEKENIIRKKIFCSNLKKIEAHNHLYEQGLSTYTQGINQFTDMTAKEFENSGYVMHLHHGGVHKH